MISALGTIALDCLVHRVHRFRHPIGSCELQCQNQARFVATTELAVVCANEGTQGSRTRELVWSLVRRYWLIEDNKQMRALSTPENQMLW
jgi:hypothetical protein